MTAFAIKMRTTMTVRHNGKDVPGNTEISCTPQQARDFERMDQAVRVADQKPERPAK
ncbi:MAG: hypothetical protein AAFN94_00830 [Pseudomonadota bacterium]